MHFDLAINILLLQQKIIMEEQVILHCPRESDNPTVSAFKFSR